MKSLSGFGLCVTVENIYHVKRNEICKTLSCYKAISPAHRYCYGHIYMIHVSVSPVLHVEGCQTLLGSVVVHRQLSGSLVAMSLWLSTRPLYFVSSLFCNFLWCVNLVILFSQCFVCRRLRLKASLPCAVLTDTGSWFQLSTTLTAKEYFLPSARAYLVLCGQAVYCAWLPRPCLFSLVLWSMSLVLRNRAQICVPMPCPFYVSSPPLFPVQARGTFPCILWILGLPPF
jgi:hypothetical protein